jgi:hypothetical protein
MAYLSQLRFDDLNHWNEDQVDFFNANSYQIMPGIDRRHLFDEFKEGFKRSPILKENYEGIFDGGYDEFNHWYSAIQSRVHGLSVE